MVNINRLTPNDPYMGRTAPLTSERCILHIYSTNIGTEYFKHALYSPFFFSSKCSLFHNANLFGCCIIHILCTGCAKIKKKIRRQKVKINILRCTVSKISKFVVQNKQILRLCSACGRWRKHGVEHGWTILTGDSLSVRRQTWPAAALSSLTPTWTVPGSN